MNESYYIIKTEYGIFHLKFTITFDRNTEKPLLFTINIGSKTNKCVQLVVPSNESGKTSAELMWVVSADDCSLEQYIKKGMAQHMVLLGLTLVRKFNKNITKVHFKDKSGFLCNLPDKTKKLVPMKPFHIAFHGATWYEYYFGAKLEKRYSEYCELKQNLYKPTSKPDTFNFISEQLQQELYPLYVSTTTWHAFFQEIARKYNNKKCAVIYPWLTYAMVDIFTSNIFEDYMWYIEFEGNNKTPMIEFVAFKDTAGHKGGQRETVKKKKTIIKKYYSREHTHSRMQLFPDILAIQRWNYLKFLHR
jgi:hypothetical protein